MAAEKKKTSVPPDTRIVGPFKGGPGSFGR